MEDELMLKLEKVREGIEVLKPKLEQFDGSKLKDDYYTIDEDIQSLMSEVDSIPNRSELIKSTRKEVMKVLNELAKQYEQKCDDAVETMPEEERDAKLQSIAEMHQELEDLNARLTAESNPELLALFERINGVEDKKHDAVSAQKRALIKEIQNSMYSVSKMNESIRVSNEMVKQQEMLKSQLQNQEGDEGVGKKISDLFDELNEFSQKSNKKGLLRSISAKLQEMTRGFENNIKSIEEEEERSKRHMLESADNIMNLIDKIALNSHYLHYTHEIDGSKQLEKYFETNLYDIREKIDTFCKNYKHQTISSSIKKYNFYFNLYQLYALRKKLNILKHDLLNSENIFEESICTFNELNKKIRNVDYTDHTSIQILKEVVIGELEKVKLMLQEKIKKESAANIKPKVIQNALTPFTEEKMDISETQEHYKLEKTPTLDSNIQGDSYADKVSKSVKVAESSISKQEYQHHFNSGAPADGEENQKCNMGNSIETAASSFAEMTVATNATINKPAPIHSTNQYQLPEKPMMESTYPKVPSPVLVWAKLRKDFSDYEYMQYLQANFETIEQYIYNLKLNLRLQQDEHFKYMHKTNLLNIMDWAGKINISDSTLNAWKVYTLNTCASILPNIR